ncbi:MAG: transaldolase [Synergistaceae bacterium]|jgi:transaldolase|nr:transaldolase [Synergistaceae bacterium]
MERTVLHETAQLGQSIWLDTISRDLLLTKGLDVWIEKGVLGVTTNPAIFEQAIAKTTDYDEEIRKLAKEGKSVAGIYETLTLQEVRAAADILRPVYDKTGVDGYVSLEVNPLLASDVESTVSEAERLFKALERPNVMIKIPATSEGIEAVEDCIAKGINVNATLIFSTGQYSSVAEACLRGLERRARTNEPLDVASVASVFVSRIDSAVDALLEQKNDCEFAELKGRIGVDNARIAYQRYRKIFDPANARWKALADRGARTQRLLWASTGTKNPAYSDVLYIENLIGPNTVNTIPPRTLSAFLDHGKAALTLENDLAEAQARRDLLSAAGIDLDDVGLKLQQDGVAAFNTAFDVLLKGIGDKANKTPVQ